MLDLAPEVLAERSKDLEITAWMIEALVRERGFAGLRDGFRAARDLVERFWDGLYPRPDEDGLSTPVAPLDRAQRRGRRGHADRARSRACRSPRGAAPARSRRGTGVAAEADRAHRGPRTARAAAGGGRRRRPSPSATPWRRRRRSSSQTLVEDLQGCVEQFERLNEALDARCGADSPPSSNVRNALQEVLDTMRFVARDYLAPADERPPRRAGRARRGAPADGHAPRRARRALCARARTPSACWSRWPTSSGAPSRTHRSPTARAGRPLGPDAAARAARRADPRRIRAQRPVPKLTGIQDSALVTGRPSPLRTVRSPERQRTHGKHPRQAEPRPQAARPHHLRGGDRGRGGREGTARSSSASWATSRATRPSRSSR